jgi:hypothetical protein
MYRCSPEERKIAPLLYQGLCAAERQFAAGERRTDVLRQCAQVSIGGGSDTAYDGQDKKSNTRQHILFSDLFFTCGAQKHRHLYSGIK